MAHQGYSFGVVEACSILTAAGIIVPPELVKATSRLIEACRLFQLEILLHKLNGNPFKCLNKNH
jgi:hypothetical protein